MSERPKSITVVCWILIIMGGISLIPSILNLKHPLVQELMAQSPITFSIQYIMRSAGLLITLVCGVAMLKRQNWARLLYVGWGVVGFIFGMVSLPMNMIIPGIIIFLIFAFFLFRPKANEYFKTTEMV